jgi:hypothetical protein
VPSAASVLIRPAKPGQPTSALSVSSACAKGVLLDKIGGEKSLLGDSSEGAGHPETSLQRNAKA